MQQSLTLPAAAAGADTLADRVQDAAVKACAVEAADSMPASHYAAITQACVYRVSTATMRRIQADADARLKASTASLDRS